MKKSNLKKGILLLGVGLISLGAMGCSPEHPQGAGDMYCDDSGCFRCERENECWAIPSCSCDAECPKGYTCSEGGCKRECELAGNCTPLPDVIEKPDPTNTSDPLSQTCTNDDGCDADQFCDGGQCAARCRSDDDCGANMVCSSCGKCQPKGVPATCGTSQIFCMDTIPCGTGKTCFANRCHFNCINNNSCSVGQVCSEGLCIDDPAPSTPECVLDLECKSGTCINGFCHAPCEQSTQCGLGSLCLMGVCQADYSPVQ